VIQVRKCSTAEQVKVLTQRYCQGSLSQAEGEEMLENGKPRFFALSKNYHQDPQAFSLDYYRQTPRRLSVDVESHIKQELLRKKTLLDNQKLHI